MRLSRVHGDGRPINIQGPDRYAWGPPLHNPGEGSSASAGGQTGASDVDEHVVTFSGGAHGRDGGPAAPVVPSPAHAPPPVPEAPHDEHGRERPGGRYAAAGHIHGRLVLRHTSVLPVVPRRPCRIDKGCLRPPAVSGGLRMGDAGPLHTAASGYPQMPSGMSMDYAAIAAAGGIMPYPFAHPHQAYMMHPPRSAPSQPPRYTGSELQGAASPGPSRANGSGPSASKGSGDRVTGSDAGARQAQQRGDVSGREPFSSDGDPTEEAPGAPPPGGSNGSGPSTTRPVGTGTPSTSGNEQEAQIPSCKAHRRDSAR